MECPRHCHGCSFTKLADQAHKSRPSQWLEPCQTYKRTRSSIHWARAVPFVQAHERAVSVAGKPHTVGIQEPRLSAHKGRGSGTQGPCKTYHRHEASGGLCRVGRGAVYVAGKPHTVGTQGSIHRHTRADTVVTQGPGDTVGTQEGTRWEGCPDGRHGALHRVHEALPRGRLLEAC